MRLALVLPILLCASAVPAGTEIETDTPTNAERRVGFSLDFYRQMASADGNLVVSPASVAIALGMTYPGTAGATADEFEKVLHLEDGDDGPLTELTTWLTKLAKAKKGPTISVANRVWVSKSYAFRKSFRAAVKKRYGATVGKGNFEGDPEGVRKEINAWVKKQTKKKIPELLPKDVFDEDTKMVLVNAVSFAGKWAEAFEKDATIDGTFTRADGSTVTAPMMTKTGGARYTIAADASVLELGYHGSTLSMLFVLPASGTLADLEAGLTTEKLATWTSSLEEVEGLEIQIPRFEMRTNTDLATVLSAMGMPGAFTPGTADFSNLLTDAALMAGDLAWIQKVIHESYIKVDESGTEAAAATAVAVGVRVTSVHITPGFVADRPFLFVLRDTSTGDILFIGRVADPTAT